MSDQANELITPKFLTKEMATLAMNLVYRMVLKPEFADSAVNQWLAPKRKQCHIVVLVPGMLDHYDQDYPDWPNYLLQPVCLAERSYLDGADKLEGPYDDIAKCKALQLWTDRNDDRTDIIPHLLFKGDAPYWGGVKRRGIVVTCSGVQPHIDKLIAGMVADLLVAMAHAAWKADPDYKEGVDFLT